METSLDASHFSYESSKRLRKGTRSCLQCRKRKIRCIWPVSSPNCEACSARKALCTQQTYDTVPRSHFKTKRMRQRIGELETTVSQIVERLRDLGLDVNEILRDIDFEPGNGTIAMRGQQDQAFEDTMFSKLSISDDLDADVEQTPFFAFFESHLLGIEKAGLEVAISTENMETHCSRAHHKYRALMKRLETIAPSRQLVHTILQESCLTLGLLRSSFADLQCMSSGNADDTNLQSLCSWIIESFDSKEPARLCKVLVLLSACIQQLSPAQQAGQRGLQIPFGSLQKQFLEAVDAFLDPHDGIVGTVDGLECLISQVTFYLHAGLPRRAWVSFRRAATFAQLVAPSSTCSDTRLLKIWMQLWQVDKSLSLLLGLPYMLMPSNVPLKPSSLHPLALFGFELGKIGARLIDRNLAGQQKMLLNDAIELDRDLNECKCSMPPQFWIPPSIHGDSTEARLAASTIKFWYHCLRNLIHLPFALNGDRHGNYEISKQAALESSNEMLCIYKLLRDPERPAIRQCDMLDFQATTAALIVIHLLLESSVSLDVLEVQLLRYSAIQTSHWLLLPAAALCRMLSHSLTDYTHFYILLLAF